MAGPARLSQPHLAMLSAADMSWRTSADIMARTVRHGWRAGSLVVLNQQASALVRRGLLARTTMGSVRYYALTDAGAERVAQDSRPR